MYAPVVVTSLLLMVITWDLLFRRVPNVLVVMALAAQVSAYTAVGAGLVGDAGAPDLLSAGVGFALGLAFFPLWRLRLMGAGDVKFLAVLGAWLGPMGLLACWIIASVMAGVHAMGVMVGRMWLPWWGNVVKDAAPWLPPEGMWGQRWQRARHWITRRRQGRRGIPYAAYLAVGALGWIAWARG
jgi:prepilin peptidase CpaA